MEKWAIDRGNETFSTPATMVFDMWVTSVCDLLMNALCQILFNVPTIRSVVIDGHISIKVTKISNNLPIWVKLQKDLK